MNGASSDNTQTPKPALRFVDTHCHLDDDAFSNDVDVVIREAELAGVTRYVNIGYEPVRWHSTIALANRFPGMHFTLGMHPGSADQWTPGTSSELAKLVESTRPVAIGEVGIDLFRGETNLAQQQAVFDQQLDLALAHDLPVVIHMRAAEREVLDLLIGRSNNPPLLFHSFEGSPELTRFVTRNGYTVGVGGLATRPKSVTIREQLERIPLEQIVLETDSPYLVPAKRRGSRNTPAHIPVIGAFLAELKGVTIETVAHETTRNAERIFKQLGAS
jgi:TatD DNase family protein